MVVGTSKNRPCSQRLTDLMRRPTLCQQKLVVASLFVRGSWVECTKYIRPDYLTTKDTKCVWRRGSVCGGPFTICTHDNVWLQLEILSGVTKEALYFVPPELSRCCILGGAVPEVLRGDSGRRRCIGANLRA